ncbi:hypothetical protein ACPPVU_12655 [Mucilaginibacter sp. McL0603]|uniref:hypothetical protein n=1 Tax=Mucilaginibacter sp. McL0603 TaxID=3415670 RepID=UPI003CEE0472
MKKLLITKKRWALPIGAIILFLFCYQVAFKKSLEAWRLHTSLAKTLAASGDVSATPDFEQKKSRNLDRIIDLYKADTADFRSNILARIAAIAGNENVKLTDVPTRGQGSADGHLHIQRLGFEGDYFSLMKTLMRLEQAKGIGMIRSATLKVSTPADGTEKMKKTVLSVYFEIFNK